MIPPKGGTTNDMQSRPTPSEGGLKELGGFPHLRSLRHSDDRSVVAGARHLIEVDPGLEFGQQRMASHLTEDIGQ